MPFCDDNTVTVCAVINDKEINTATAISITKFDLLILIIKSYHPIHPINILIRLLQYLSK